MKKRQKKKGLITMLESSSKCRLPWHYLADLPNDPMSIALPKHNRCCCDE